MKTETMNNIHTLDELLMQKYGPKGSMEREAFEAKAQAFYICELLKEERKKANLTQEDLAEKLNLNKSYISRVENGKADVQLSTLIRIAEGLGFRLALLPFES